MSNTDHLIAAAREWSRDKSSGFLINELADEIERLRRGVSLDFPTGSGECAGTRAEKVEVEADRMRVLLRMAWLYSGMVPPSPVLLADLHNAIDDSAGDIGLRLPA